MSRDSRCDTPLALGCPMPSDSSAYGGQTVVPRLSTVLSQAMEPMVTPSKVARVPNLRSTSQSVP